MLIGYPFFPESPYLLISRGNNEGARQSLLRIHGSREPALVDAELARLNAAAALSLVLNETIAEDGPGWLQCLKGTNLVINIPPSILILN